VKLELLIAWRYLGAQRKNIFVFLITLFSILGVGIGTFALVVALSAANGFEGEVTSKMIGKDAHFEVLMYHNQPMPNYDSVSTKVLEHPEVRAVAPYIVYKMGISSRKVNDGIVIYGIDADDSRKVLNIHNTIRWGQYSLDSTLDTTGRHRATIMLGSTLARRLRVVLGDKVVLQTFQSPEAMAMGGGAPRMAQFLVGGIFETGMYEYDANLAYISIEAAQHLLDMPGSVSGMQGVVRDPWISEIVADQLEETLKYPYYAVDWKSKNSNLLKWINYEKVIIGVVLFLIILVAAFNIISSLIMVVLGKTREIGILRAMGMSSGGVMRVFIYMGGFIGLAGSTMGALTGTLLCWAQLKWQFIKLPPDVYSISVFPVRMEWSDVMSVFMLANVLCILATIFPAWKASRLDPAGAIRHE
jgi:lipoprotein-releasing system permease protein